MSMTLPCPNCKLPGSVTNIYGSIWQCSGCSRDWPNMSSYEVSAVLLGVTKDKPGDYVTEGGLQADLDKLIHLVAVGAEASLAREILKSARDLCDGKSYSAGLREVMDFLQNLVTVTEHMEERARE